MQQGWEECSQKHCGVPYWLPGAAIAQPPDQNRRVTEFPMPQRHYFNGKRWTGSHTYLLASPRTGQGQRCVFGSLWLSLNITSFVQQHFYHSYMPSGSSQDQRGKTWGENEVGFIFNRLKSYRIIHFRLLCCLWNPERFLMSTFFVPMFNIGPPCNENRYEFLMSSCAR